MDRRSIPGCVHLARAHNHIKDLDCRIDVGRGARVAVRKTETAARPDSLGRMTRFNWALHGTE